MPGYVLAQVQVRWGNENLARFNEAMRVLVDLFAQEGVRLATACSPSTGASLRGVDFREVEDAEHMNRARAGLLSKDEYHWTHAVLSEVVESEQLRYLQSLPLAP